MTFSYETRTHKDGTTTYSKTINLGNDPITGKRRQTRISAKTVKELKRLYTAELHTVQNGDYYETSNATLAEYLKHWLGAIEPTIRPSSHRRFSEVVNGRIVPALGNVKLADVSPLHVQELYARCLTTGLSSTTVALYHNVLHRALDQAVKWRMIARNVCDAVDPPREANPETKTWTTDEARSFLRLAASDDLAALWLLALNTGIRRGELLALRWQDLDLDLDRGALAIRRTLTRGTGALTFGEPKSKAGRRSLALPAVCVDALRAHRVTQLERRLSIGPAWQDNDLIFERGDGSLLHPNSLLNAFFRLTAAAGVPRIRFHDLRHTAATLMLANGEHPKIVQERLGHSDISMTLNRYSHVTMDMQRDAADRLAKLLS